jgi:hypothetical protein
MTLCCTKTRKSIMLGARTTITVKPLAGPRACGRSGGGLRLGARGHARICGKEGGRSDGRDGPPEVDLSFR